MTEPVHLVKARSFIGFREQPGNRGIEEFTGGAKTGRVGDAWCAIFANFCFETTGTRGTRSALARSFERSPHFERLAVPRLGCVVTFWRGSPTSGQGHVGFYTSETATEIEILSGNDDDQVQIDGHPKARFTGYWWPVDVATAPEQAFTDITATVFEDAQVAYSNVAPGWNSRPGVALPGRFSGVRPKVRVTHRGKSVVCDIVDVGPWNTDDPYWRTRDRPQAETGTDRRGRKTNKAGIDLTPAAADAIDLPGKGLVDWEFVTNQPEKPVTDPIKPDAAESQLGQLIVRMLLQLLLQRLGVGTGGPVLPAPDAPPKETPVKQDDRAADTRTAIVGAGGTLLAWLAGLLTDPTAAAIGTTIVTGAAGGLPSILLGFARSFLSRRFGATAQK
jgi:uncharacterized protein (TIGR02594 family)